MRALNSTASRTITKANSTKPSHRKQNPAAETPALDHLPAHGTRFALNSSTTSTPRRPSSRQSGLSSFSTVSVNNSKTGIRHQPSSESLRAISSRPIITATVAKSARATPSPGANSKQNNDSTSTTKSRTNPAKPSSTSSRPSSSLPAARPPLKSRDQNVSPMTDKAPSMSRNVKVTMPAYDRSPNTNGGRPQMPMLSSTAGRGPNRPAITPKIATKPLQAPTLAANAHTPLPKRTVRPASRNSAIPAPSRGTPQPEDDPNPLISLNVTPRSGKRQSRVDSANSTPNGTPNPDRNDGWDRDSSRSGRAMSPTGNDGDASQRPVVAFNSLSADLHAAPKQDSPADIDSKFFHASDMKHAPQTQPRPTLAKAPTFFYANGTTVENKTSVPGSYTSAPSHRASQDNLSSKFVYANGTPDLKPSAPAGTSRPGSVISMGSKAPSSRPPTSSHSGGSSTAHRPLSPVKISQQPQSGHPKATSMQSLMANRPHATLPPQLGPPPALRRTSTGTSRSAHSRNSSLNMGDVDLKGSFLPSAPTSPLPLASPSLQPPLTLASIIQAAEDFADDESITSPDDSRSEIQSPTKSTHPEDPLNDLVANARRERKVQDLQITNASLEAINRTLERQLRKQTAELRRFKRMSRAGHLSMISSAASSRVVSDAHSIRESIDGLALSDLDEENSDDGFDEEDTLSDTDSASDSVSPSLMAERDARYRKRDEKRLQLDLSKHQELLIDSQKINQSIKRCLDWTEELIKEGKKALDYKVRVSDVVVPGPRVLNPVDEEEERTQTSINFDPDTTFEDNSSVIDGSESPSERIIPLEPKLAGWTPEAQDDAATYFPSNGN